MKIVYLTYALLIVLICVTTYFSFKQQDPILFILGLFATLTGFTAVSANKEFGRSLKRYREQLERIKKL